MLVCWLCSAVIGGHGPVKADGGGRGGRGGHDGGRGVEVQRYSCRHARRGRCVIINNHHFNRVLTSQPDRDGTQVDAAAVESLFLSLGFDVSRYDDLTINDMSIQLREGL